MQMVDQMFDFEKDSGLLIPTDGKKLIWLTNEQREQVPFLIQYLQMGQTTHREILEHDPKATEVYSIDELKDMGVVGLYEFVEDKDTKMNSKGV